MTIELPENSFPKVVIIGGGFGGISLAKKLRSKEVQVIMFDRHNYHTFQPLLYQVATGGLEPDSIAYPLRKIFKNQKNFTFRVAEVLSIDPEKKLIQTSIGHTDYDFLVIATGSETNFFGNKEMEQTTMPMKTIPEALDLRSLILQHFEAALLEDSINEQEAHMNFVVVGGGPTGVEICGALAELKNHVLPKDYPDLDLRKMQINLVEGTPELLSAMSDNSSTKAAKFLKEMGVNLWLNARVLNYDSKTVTLDTGRKFESYNVIWTAGVKGKVIDGLDPDVLVKGNRYKVNEFNQVAGYEDIFAIGDVAAAISEEYPNGHPGVAPTAIQHGNKLAKNIVRLINGAPMEPFSYFDKGSMATIGRNKAVVDIGYVRFAGLFAWFVWMFVHLMTLVGFRNKMVVFVNWIWNYFSFDRGIRLIIRPVNRKKGITNERDTI